MEAKGAFHLSLNCLVFYILFGFKFCLKLEGVREVGVGIILAGKFSYSKWAVNFSFVYLIILLSKFPILFIPVFILKALNLHGTLNILKALILKLSVY